MQTVGDAGQYSVVKPLAAGGMGEVLLAEHLRDDDLGRGLVVLKRVRPDVDGEPPEAELVQMLREEARLGLRLVHANLVETFRLDDGTLSTGPLLVMEFLPGQPLSKILGAMAHSEQLCSVAQALAVLRAACCGLHFAHTLRGRDGQSLGMVHRDLTPSNIVVTFDGRVKVIDFGVAKAPDSPLRTTTGVLKGKAGYVAPERWLGSRSFSGSVDLWSLGVICWETLTTKRLFRARNPEAVASLICEDPIPLVSWERSDIPPAVDALVAGLLERDVTRRFASCAAVVAAIDALPIAAEVHDVRLDALLAGLFPDFATVGVADARRCARRRNARPAPIGLVEGGGVDLAEADVKTASRVRAVELEDRELRALRRASPSTGMTARISALDETEMLDDPGLPAGGTRDDDGRSGSSRAAPPSTSRSERTGTADAPIDADATLRIPALDEPGWNALPSTVADANTSRLDRSAAIVEAHPRGRSEKDATAQRSGFDALPPTRAQRERARFNDAVNDAVNDTAEVHVGIFRDQNASPGTSSFAGMPVTYSGHGLTSPIAPVDLSGSTSGSERSAVEATAPLVRPGERRIDIAVAGLIVLALGVVGGFVLGRPVPASIPGYIDEAGQVVLVGDPDQVPAKAMRRFSIDPAAPLLPSKGGAVVRADAAALRAQLEQSGVWDRAALSNSHGRGVRLMTAVLTCIGMLTLFVGLLASVRAGRRRTAVRLVLMVVGFGAFLGTIARGTPSWSGASVWRSTPTLRFDD